MMGHVSLPAAVGVHDVDLGVAVTPADEGDLTPVRRPARPCADRAVVDLPGVSRQPSRSAAAGIARADATLLVTALVETAVARPVDGS